MSRLFAFFDASPGLVPDKANNRQTRFWPAREVNYLAHLFLAEDEPESRVASLMGDFFKGPLDDTLAPKLRQGIALHRRVDAFTDAHPVFKTSRRRVRPELYRYSGIVIDVFYDHYLATQWNSYSSVPFDTFCQSVYRALRDHYDALPERMQRSVRHMLANDLLQSYRDIDGIGRALRGIEGRLKRPSGLSQAIGDLEQYYGEFDRDFKQFFADLLVYTQHSHSL